MGLVICSIGLRGSCVCSVSCCVVLSCAWGSADYWLSCVVLYIVMLCVVVELCCVAFDYLFFVSVCVVSCWSSVGLF